MRSTLTDLELKIDRIDTTFCGDCEYAMDQMRDVIKSLIMLMDLALPQEIEDD